MHGGPVPEANLPRHVAIIVDGNGRWAEARGLARSKGHLQGGRAVATTIRRCRELAIPYLTLFGFSVANWSRPANEAGGIMDLIAGMARALAAEYARSGIRVRLIGSLQDLPAETRTNLEEIVERTSHCADLIVTVAVSYGARRDLAAAARLLAMEVAAGTIRVEDVDPHRLRSKLSTSELPDPDLLIRTGGEQRLSDFLLFEAADAELYFTDTLWPEFDEKALDRALADYAGRERRFGRTPAQVRAELDPGRAGRAASGLT